MVNVAIQENSKPFEIARENLKRLYQTDQGFSSGTTSGAGRTSVCCMYILEN
jgi:hypothetical protein